MAELAPDVAYVRKRPSGFVRDTGRLGLSELVDYLLDVTMEEARRGTLQNLSLSLGEDGGVELVEDGSPVPPEELADLLTRLKLDLADPAYDPLRFKTVSVFALSEHFELEAWDAGRHWRLRGKSGVIRELPSPEPLQQPPSSGPRGTRVRFCPDRTLFEPTATFDARHLHMRCRELAALTPGLVIDFHSPRLREWFQYPRGLSDLVDELTQVQAPCMNAPLVAEAQWEEIRVRCALQWTQDLDCRIWSFANTVRTLLGGEHVQGMLEALWTAMSKVAPRKKPPTELRMLLGLTLVIAVDGPRSRVILGGPTRERLDTKGLREGIVSVLTPVLMRELRKRMEYGVPWSHF